MVGIFGTAVAIERGADARGAGPSGMSTILEALAVEGSGDWDDSRPDGPSESMRPQAIEQELEAPGSL